MSLHGNELHPGDFFSEQYTQRWLRIMKNLPRVKFWWYSRSWRVPAIEAVLREMALLDNCRGWYSLDRDCANEVPAERPEGIRYCFLQDVPEVTTDADLVFRTRQMLNQPRLSLPVICPTDTPQGRQSNQITCGSCGLCFD